MSRRDPYAWVDPWELVAKIDAYVEDQEERHHQERRRMANAFADENYVWRRRLEEGASKLADATAPTILGMPILRVP